MGILALQGGVAEHLAILKQLGVEAVLVKLPRDLERIDRLIIPGGESTTIGKLLVRYKLLAPLKARIKKGMPVWGTCAGGILMAKRIQGASGTQPKLSVMDITAHRNAFGPQLESFETRISMRVASQKPVPVLFIRAPLFKNPGKNIEVLARLPNKAIIAAQENRTLVTSFHPELAGSTEIHRYFLSL